MLETLEDEKGKTKTIETKLTKAEEAARKESALKKQAEEKAYYSEKSRKEME